MNTKKQTSVSVMREIERIKNACEEIDKKQIAFKKEKSAFRKQLKELEKTYDTLYHEELQNKIAAVWLKDGKISDENIVKILALGEGIRDKIDNLDTGKAIKAIMEACDDGKKEKVITNDNFSDEADETEEDEKVVKES